MVACEYNWHDVFNKYVQLVSSAKAQAFIRDVTDLPYPRKIIKATILAFIRVEKDHRKRELMKAVYLTLANFQGITAQEREAVHIMSQLDDPALPHAQLTLLAKRISGVSAVYQDVLRRYEADLQQLREDLSALSLS